MRSSDWRQVGDLFDAASELSSDERAAFLEEHCGPDAELRQEVERLLRLDGATPDSFLASPVAAAPPSQVGAYELEHELHRGGMGVVYRARRRDGDFSQTVAIKITAPAMDEHLRRRFEVERRILARLQHPGIARLYDGGTLEDGRPFLVMEYIEGIPITEYCDRRRLGVAARARLFLKVLDAVDFAHRHLVVHRDLKPGNVLVTERGEPKLLDFGIAKLRGGHSHFGPAVTTEPGERLLTPGYASPEQATGRPIGVASDVYSAGVLLYELLAGIPPYRLEPDATLSELWMAICARPPLPLTAAADSGGPRLAEICAARSTRPRDLRSALGGDLATVLAVALRKEPERRYASVAALAEDLRRALESRPLQARPDSLPYRARKFAGRHRLGVSAAGLLIAMAITVFALVVHQNSALAQERDKVRRSMDLLVEIFSVSDPSRAVGDTVPARQLLENGARRAADDLAGEPEIQSSMLTTLGRIYSQIGLYGPARDLLRQGLEGSRSALGEEHPQVAEALHHLGQVALAEGRVEDAERDLGRALELRRGVLGGAHPNVAESLEALGALHELRYDYAAAETALRQALGLRRRHGEPTAIARILEALAGLLAETENRGEAAELLEESLTLRRGAQPPEHPEIGLALRRLATLRFIEGEYAGAVPLYEEALAILREALGDEHREVAGAVRELGTSYFFLDRFADCETLLRESLALQRRLAGDDTPESADAVAHLLVAVRSQGRLEEAAELAIQHLELIRRFFGEDHPKIAYGYFLAAGVELGRGDLAAAEAATRRTLEINARHLPPGHRAHAYPWITLAKIRLRQDRYAEAEELLQRALPVLSKSHDADHWRLADVRVLLALALGGQGDLEAAQELVAGARPLLAAQLGRDNTALRRALGTESRLQQAALAGGRLEPFAGRRLPGDR